MATRLPWNEMDEDDLVEFFHGYVEARPNATLPEIVTWIKGPFGVPCEAIMLSPNPRPGATELLVCDIIFHLHTSADVCVNLITGGKPPSSAA